MSLRWMLILCCLPLFLQAAPIEKVIFFDGNLSSAKQLAAQEGKLYFAEFTASWCAPCRVLEETTFTDPRVISYIEQHYIPVKVDIDDFDGIALKQVYNVQTIPTVIFFNSQGELLEKYDKNLPASKMLALLQKHNTPQNSIVTPQPTTSPSHYNTYQSPEPQKATIPIATPNQSSQINPTHSPIRTPTSASKPDKQPVVPKPVSDDIPLSSSPVVPTAQGDGLYRFRVQEQASDGFSIQIGAFGEYGNVLREVARIQDHFSEPLIVHIMKNPDKTLYKVMIGDFDSRQQAMDYRLNLQEKGLEGVIRDMRMLK